ncbi:MAG: Gfo/Idh/MocA family protein [Gemmataceae bacterium]
MSSAINRRQFTAGAVALGAAASLQRGHAANERIRLGFIGVGNRGDQLLDAFLPHSDAEIVALCDVYEPYREGAQKKVGGKATLYHDYRKLLEQKDIDAVVIATPDHWHALQFVDACRAGKDVYVEKPVSLTIAEGRKMCEVAADSNRVTQVGLHRRSLPMCQELVKRIHAGEIGKVTVAKSFHLRNEGPYGIGKPADGSPPKGLDWEFGLGPAPQVPYNRTRCLYKFRWFLDYSGGQLTNFGTHYLDMIQWALGQEAPKGVVAVGGKYAIDDNREIPDTLEVVWEYDNCIVTFSQYNANSSPGNALGYELEFRGTNGTLLTYEHKGFEIVPQKVRTLELPALDPLARDKNREQARAVRDAGKAVSVKKEGDATTLHARNFLDCVKSRKTTNCPIETGHRSTTATLLARIAVERGRYLVWDAAKERFTNDDEANKLLSYEYRQPWKLA